MRFEAALLLALAVLPVVSGDARAQGSSGDAPAEQTPEPPIVAILGASVSAGFTDPRLGPDGERNSTVELARMLRAVWPEDSVRFRDRSDFTTFTAPERRQRTPIERTVADDPALVVAIDFLFWFGYGSVGSAEDRYALQQRGFDMLDRLAGPIVIGDYPDMHGADPTMLPAGLIPDREVLEELCRRVRAFAEERPHVHVFPLAAFVADAREGGVEVELGGETRTLPTPALFQSDRLHPNRLGMAVLTARFVDWLRGELPEEHPLRPPPIAFEALVAAAGAEEELALALGTEEPAGAGRRR